MSTAIRALEKELGELVALHRSGDQLAEIQEKYRDDFCGFVTDVLGEILTDQQRDVAESVRDNRFTLVASCNAYGKDWLASRLALHFVICKGGKCIVSGPTERQIYHVMFSTEIRTAWRKLRGKVAGELRTQSLNVRGGGSILGFTATNISGYTGHHDPSGVMVVLTESQGLEEWVFRGSYALMAGPEDRLLAVGNPLFPSGPWWAASKNPAWKVFNFDAHTHINVTSGREVIKGAVTQSFIDSIRDMYGEDSVEWTSQVLGKWPRDGVHGLLSRPSLDASVELWHRRSLPPGMSLRCGIDVGRDHDKTALCFVAGPVVTEIIELEPCGDLSITQDQIESLLWARGFSRRASVGEYGTSANGRLIIDASGLGAGVYDNLKARGWSVGKPFLGGASAYRSDVYSNTRAESFFLFKHLIEAGELAIPPDEMLMEEAAAVQWSITPQSKKLIEKKDDLRLRLGRSTDRLDACTMATYRPRGRRTASGLGDLVTF